jgi:hypothetical protein
VSALFRKLKTFVSLPVRYKLFFFINYVLCGIAKALILIFPYRVLSRYFGYSHRMTIASTLPSVEQCQRAKMLGKAVRLAARYTPWDSSCLTQALVARFWCRYWNIPYFLFIGLQKKSEKPLGREAHAWLTVGAVPVTGGYCFDAYHVISSFSSLRS